MTSLDINALARLSTAARARDHFVRNINRKLNDGRKVRVSRQHFADKPFNLIDASNNVLEQLDARAVVLLAHNVGALS